MSFEMLSLPELKENIVPTPRVLMGIVLMVGIIVWSLQHHLSTRSSKSAPSVPYWAPFGIDLFVTAINRIYSHDFFAWTRQILDVPGRTVSMNLLGIKLLMTDDPENTKAVLSTKFVDFGKGEAFHKIWRDLMFDSIFATDGALWHDNKDLLRNHTAKSRPTDYAVSERHVTALIRNLSDGDSHDCLDQMDRFILDVVSDVFFGETAGTLSTELQPLRDAVEEMYIWNTQRILIGKLGALLPGTAKASAVLVKYLDRAIDQAMRVQDKEADGELDRKQNTLLVGFNIRTALRDTALPVGGGSLGKDSIQIPKGTHVGTLELVSGRRRFTLADCNNTESIVMSYIGTQRRHDLVGPTADDFDPSRWDNWTPKTWEFLPFNHGPRICLGRNFAWMQMEYLICRVFQEFASVELLGENGELMIGGEEMKIKIALNTKPAKPVIVKFARQA
ncbi:MAG: hypothetical protein Q9198_004357 [Flavoplaca austrocitrina]